jgi:hypothetical protein
MKENIKKIHVQRILYVGFFCVNDNKDVDMNAHKPRDVLFVMVTQFYFVTLKLKQEKV